VKKVVKLAFFFSFCFILILLLAAAAIFLARWLDAARYIPARSLALFSALKDSLQRCLPAALYGALAFSLAYACRKKTPAFVSMLCLFVLSLGLGAGFSLGLERLAGPGAYQGELTPPRTLGEPGLILSQGDTATILLADPGDAGGARVISLQDRPLLYEENPPGPAFPELPPAPFDLELPGFITSLGVDLSLAARNLENRLAGGNRSLIVYLGALCFFLVSLRFMFTLSVWPLASATIALLVFRGILSLEVFLNTASTQNYLAGLLGGLLPGEPLPGSVLAAGPGALVSPVILAFLGVLALLVSLPLSRRRQKREAGHG
jgi:hypothetical protein